MPPAVGPPTTSINQPPINGGYPGMSNGPPTSGLPSWSTPYLPNMAPQPHGQPTLGSTPAADPRRQYPQVVYFFYSKFSIVQIQFFSYFFSF